MLGIKIYTWIFGHCVGEDIFGNRYYTSSRTPQKRWVLYKGEAQASKVPAEWHGWLHHMMDSPPDKINSKVWQKDHLPNLSGTPYAYHPKGAFGKRASATGDYKAWTPRTQKS
jgi:NADH:ubiquinone oxidoreductase subunit